MNAIELLQKSIGKWEGRRFYTYDNGEKITRYTQFTNELIPSQNFLFADGISVYHTFKVWNVTEVKFEHEMSTILHAKSDCIVRAIGYLEQENIECPITSINENMCKMITTYKNGWTHLEMFHYLNDKVRARNIRYDGINCSGTFLENKLDEFPEVNLENLVSLVLNI
jgi:hypothetical protein